jgi:signal peptide peptidase SppA
VNRTPHSLRMLAGRVLNTPLALDPSKLAVILSVLGPRLEVDLDQEVRDAAAAMPAPATRDRQAYQLVGDVAVIDVFGTLVHRSSGLDAMSGLTSYEQLARELAQAIADPAVKSVVLQIDSPGGEIAGLFDMADAIAEAGTVKPVYAVAEDMAASAAYLLGAAAQKFFAPPAATIGSIGIVYAYPEQSASGAPGVKLTYFHAGDRKLYPGRQLNEDLKGDIQARVEGVYDLFTARAASFRGISQASVKNTEARVYLGAEAAQLGLVDGVKSFRQVVGDLSTTGQLSRAPSFAAAAASAEEPESKKSSSLVDADGPRAIADEEPPTGGNQEVAMGDTKKNPGDGAGEVVDLKAVLDRVSALEAENTTLKAKSALDAATSLLKEKAAVIAKHQERGALTPAMVPLAMKIAETATVEELEKALAAYPSHPALAKDPVPAGSSKVDAGEGFQLDAEAKVIAAKFGWSEKELAAYAGIRKIQAGDAAGAKAVFGDGKKVLLKDLLANAGRA